MTMLDEATVQPAVGTPLEPSVGRLLDEGTKGQAMGLKWQMVPVDPTNAMWDAAVAEDNRVSANWPGQRPSCFQIWKAMLAAAPEPPHMSMTREEAQTFQSWAGMDGAIAFHLIERHADGWGDVGRMMDAWLHANKEPPNVRGNAHLTAAQEVEDEQ